MGHLRQQVREQAQQLLAAETGLPVHINRITPFAASDLPCLAVSTPTDRSEAQTLMTYRRDIDLSITVYSRMYAGADDVVDDIAAEIETAMLSGAITATLISTTVDLSPAGDQPIATAELAYVITLHGVSLPTQPITI